MILGLTGGYCSGKSTVAARLRDQGWTIIDVDALGHRALERSLDSVELLLGPAIRARDGGPDRRAIGARVFGDSALLARYEAIVHPVMNRLVTEAIEDSGSRVCIDAAILYRLPAAAICDGIIEVRSPLIARISRGRRRDGLGLCAILRRMRSQRPLGAAGKRWSDKTVFLLNRGSPWLLDGRINEALARIDAIPALNRPFASTDT
ncbi:MAG TPA: dephospho-CoA kinase [bacterium]|nr:dephospho-CoA kinase [bacterium]